MKHRIEYFEGVELVGLSDRMSIQENKTPVLWKELITRIKKDGIAIPDNKYSVEVYDDSSFFDAFNPRKEYTKWATVNQEDIKESYQALDRLTIPKGKYIVYSYVGSVKLVFNAYQWIFSESLSNLGLKLDNRPHFSLMTKSYLGDHENSQEELWVPIK